MPVHYFERGVKEMRRALIVMLVLIVGYGVTAMACTSILVGKDASVDGSTMVTHTCDGSYDARLQVIPGGVHEEGETVSIYKGLCQAGIPGRTVQYVGEIPQVPETYTYFHTGYPFMNEHQVIIGETTWSGERALRNSQGWMTIEQLQVLGLQRGKTAREVIQIMGELAEKYGYGDGGEGLTVIDGDEAWLFEICGPGPFWSPGSEEPGAVWVAQRIPDDHVLVHANRSRIGEIDLENTDYFMASPNVYSTALELELWDGQEPFLFYAAYGPKNAFYNTRREWRVLDLLAPSLELDPWAERYPLSVKPDKKVSAQDLMMIKRDHYEGTEFDLTVGLAAGPFGNPNRYATPASARPEGINYDGWERAISMFRCSYVIVGQARNWMPDAIGGVVWFGEDAPHSTVYIPFYAGATSVPESFSQGARDFFDRSSAWWAFNHVSNLADLRYNVAIEIIKEEYTKFETEFLANQPLIEKVALDLYAENPEAAIDFITNYSNGLANRVVDRWWKLADELIYTLNDGYVDGKTVGYPTWWLEAVGYGDTTAR
ncbi:Peptidase U34 dipeptidase [Mesotoga infera]|nr:dipeptidase [Mesotoga sp.]CCU84492.1 Peptidase U34 dipeptidase [Mesotoga infera]